MAGTSSATPPAQNRVQSYIDGIVDGTIPAGRLQRLAVERHLKDLLNGKDRGLWFDEDAARRVITFFERYTVHTLGREWAGKPFILEPWQAFILWVLFGWKRDDGSRRFRLAYLCISRKNGKSTLAAAIGLYLLLADCEPGAEVYSVATKRDQARIVHKEAVRMVKRSPVLKAEAIVQQSLLAVPDTDSEFKPLSSDTDGMDGINVHGAIVDELHKHKTRDVFDIITTATAARSQPLVFCITNAGDSRQSVCWEQQDYSEKVLSGIIEDDSHFAFVTTPDEDDDWRDETTWRKANPNLDVSIKIDKLREEAKRAEESPAREAAFRRYYLSQWWQQVNKWLKVDDWNATGRVDFGVLEETLVGMRCCAGIDLASTTDTASLVLVFRPDETHYAALPFFWVPEDTVEERARSRIPYATWVDKGMMMATPGNVIDYAFIREKVLELKKIFRIREIAYDTWAATQLVQELEAEGLQMVPFVQGIKSYNAPTKELLKLVVSGRIEHGNHPVLAWQASNLCVYMDASGNVRPVKEKSPDKIDGMCALIMGIDRASRHPASDTKPEYLKRGFASL